MKKQHTMTQLIIPHDEYEGNQIPDSQIKTHERENNQESEQHLYRHRKKFSKKCNELLIRLCNGERLQFADCVRTIGDLRRRSLDLIEAGIPIQRDFLYGSDVKTYYIKQENIEAIKNKFL